MNLTVQMPVVRQAASARHGPRSSSFSVKCFNCGRSGHMRDTCPVPRRVPTPLPAGGYGLHTPRQGWMGTHLFRSGNVGRQCFVCGTLGHLAKDCLSREGGLAGGSSQRQYRPTGRVMYHQGLDTDVTAMCLKTVSVNTATDFPMQGSVKEMELSSSAGSCLRGTSGRCLTATSPRSQAMGFPKVTPRLHV